MRPGECVLGPGHESLLYSCVCVFVDSTRFFFESKVEQARLKPFTSQGRQVSLYSFSSPVVALRRGHPVYIVHILARLIENGAILSQRRSMLSTRPFYVNIVYGD